MKPPEMILRKCITRGCKETVNLPVYWRNWLKCYTCVFGPLRGVTHVIIQDGVCENSLVPIVDGKDEEKIEWKKHKKEMKEAINSWFKKTGHRKAA